MKLSAIFLILSLFTLLLFPLSMAYVIVDNKVIEDNAFFYLSQYPATVQDAQEVTIEFELKQSAPPITLALGMNSEELKPQGLKLYNPHNVSTPKERTCGGNHYNASGGIAYCYQYNAVNETYNLLWSQAYESVDIPSKTIYWTETTIEDYTNIASTFNKANTEVVGKDTWYYRSGLTPNVGQRYTLKLDIRPTFNTGGKYDLALFPSSYGSNLAGAEADGKLFLLDPWWNTTYYRMIPITINNSQVKGALKNYSVYLDLSTISTSTFWNNIKSDCSDIRFTNSDNVTQLPLEVVWCDTTEQTGEVYFRGNVSNTTSTVFHMWFNNSAVTFPPPDSPYGYKNVWQDYIHVFHLNESSGSARDSAGLQDGTFSGSLPTRKTGKIGGSQYFDGVDDFVDMGNSWNPVGNVFSFQAWVNISTTARYRVFGKTCAGSCGGEAQDSWSFDMDESGRFDMYFDDRNEASYIQVNDGTAHTDGLYHSYVVTVGHDPNMNVYGYVDGFYTHTGSDSTTHSYDNIEEIRIGANHGEDLDMLGEIDEVRLRPSTLNASWIETEFLNYDDPASFTLIGSPVQQDSLPIVSSVSPLDNVRSKDNPDIFQISLSNAAADTDCTLYLNSTGTGYFSASVLYNQSTGTINFTSVSVNETAYNWSVYCQNGVGNDTSEIRQINYDFSPPVWALNTANFFLATNATKFNPLWNSETAQVNLTVTDQIINAFNFTLSNSSGSVKHTNATSGLTSSTENLIYTLNTTTWKTGVFSVSLYGIDNNSLNNATKLYSFNVSRQPHQAENFTATATGKTWIFLSWNKTSDATGVTLYYANQTPIGNFFTNNTLNITGLTVGTTYQFYVDAFYNETGTLRYNGSTGLISASTFTNATLTVFVYNEVTQNLILEDIFINLISGVSNKSGTTSAGSLSIQNITTSNYTIRHSGLVWGLRDQYLVIDANSTTNLTLYLLNDSFRGSVEVFVTDARSNPLNGVVVKLLRYYGSSNSYQVVEMATTANDGRASMSAQHYDAFYRWIIEYQGETLLITDTPENILPETDGIAKRTFSIDIGNNFYTSYINDVQIGRLVTFNNATNTLTFVWNDPTGIVTQGCLEASYISGASWVIEGPNCTSGAIGTVFLTLSQPINSTGYRWVSKLHTNTDYSIIADTGTIENIRTFVLGKLGVFAQVGLLVGGAILFSFSAVAVMLWISINLVGALFLSFAGYSIIPFGYTAVISLITLFVGVFAIFMMRR